MIEPLEFVLPELTPSLNTQAGRHWSASHQEGHRWDWLLAEARGKVRRWERPNWPHVRLTIVRKAVQPIRDEDNLQGGVKRLVDALVRGGYFPDDSNEVIVRRHVLQERVATRSEQCTVVRIEPYASPSSAEPVNSC